MIEMLACPNISCTNLGCLPAMSNIVAHVWRRSCSRMAGSSARLSSGLKCLPKRFVPLVVVPVVVGKTSPLSCQREPSRSFFLCLPRAVASDGFCGFPGELYGTSLAALGKLELVSSPGLR